MNYKLKLDVRENQKRKKGFPVVVFLSDKNKIKKVNLGLFFEKSQWNFKEELPLQDQKALIIIRKKILLLENILLEVVSGKQYSLEQVKQLLLGNNKIATTSFYVFFEDFIAELKENSKNSTAKGYENALQQLKKFRAELFFTDLNYTLLNKFKDWRYKKGNKKNTIATYLSKYRAVYNEAVKRNVVNDTQPFKDVFSGVIVKSNRTKKRYLDKKTITILENLQDLTFAEQRSVDLWLLLFYFGGQDLKDVYYLQKKQVSNGRVYFVRGKLGEDGYEFDLKIEPKAQKIIDKYTAPGPNVFGWRKDFDGYRTFRANLRRNLLKVVKEYNAKKENQNNLIQVLPKGGNISIKVARHSFRTIGKHLFIDSVLLQELMGHELDTVSSIYEDKYPEKVRDEAHLKIIE